MLSRVDLENIPELLPAASVSRPGYGAVGSQNEAAVRPHGVSGKHESLRVENARRENGYLEDSGENR